MSLSSLLTLLKINVSYLELFIRHFITAIENIRFEIYFLFFEFKHTEFFNYSRRLFAKHHTLTFPGVGLSVAGPDRAKFGFYRFRSFFCLLLSYCYRFY